MKSAVLSVLLVEVQSGHASPPRRRCSGVEGLNAGPGLRLPLRVVGWIFVGDCVDLHGVPPVDRAGAEYLSK